MERKHFEVIDCSASIFPASRICIQIVAAINDKIQVANDTVLDALFHLLKKDAQKNDTQKSEEQDGLVFEYEQHSGPDLSLSLLVIFYCSSHVFLVPQSDENFAAFVVRKTHHGGCRHQAVVVGMAEGLPKRSFAQ
jgi:hypothetical protein